MNFEFATAGRIIFGANSLRQAGPLAREFGGHALVLTGRDPGRAEGLLSGLAIKGVESTSYQVKGEPDLDTVTRGTALALEQNVDLIIAFGGGSVIDAGKAVAAMAANEGNLLDYLEVIGQGRLLTRPSLPMIAIPTTAGTGSEVTRNAVLGSPAHGLKVSLRSPFMLPRAALIDPTLTYSLPPEITASTGLDALTQVIEPYLSLRAHPVADQAAREGMSRAARSLRRAFTNGSDAQAREEMALASLMGGLALANAGLGAVHGLAGPIGGMFPAPHGAVFATLLPHVMQSNLQALHQREPRNPVITRFDDVARLLTGDTTATGRDGIWWVRNLVRDLGIPPLSTYGIQPAHFEELAGNAARASSMKANPILLTPAEITAILNQAL